MNLIIRPYTKQDRETVLALLRLNVPIYFAPEEEADFLHYLNHEIESYFVVETDGLIVGCGGFNFSGNPQVGKISWDFIHPDFQGKSIGSFLLNHRLNLLKNSKDIQKIIVRTSQHAYGFYEKNGFRILDKKVDYWAPGFDLYLMEYTF